MQSNSPMFLETSLACIARGWYVFPCWPGTKKPMTPHGFKDASADEAQVRAWWTKAPNANVAIACGPSNLAVVDMDEGPVQSVADLEAWIVTAGLPRTFAVRTGRRVSKKDGTPEFGVQLYYTDAVPDIGLWKHAGGSGQIKSLGGYVMAAGSIHPDSKAAYDVLWDEPLVTTPGTVRALKTVSLPVVLNGPMQKIGEGAGRHAALTSVAGKLRASGLDGDAIYEAMVPINPAMCEVPISDEDLKYIAHGVAKRYPVPVPEPVVVLGQPRPIDPSLDEDDLEDSPRPKYPDEVWNGTAYGEFADLCTRDNFIPKKFFSESMRTVVGAIVGDRLRCPITGVTPRMYTVKIAPPGSGKGTSDEYVRLFFCSERWNGLERTEAPLLWDSPQEFLWRGRGIGAQSISPASAPGLIKAIEQRKAKANEAANPLETWKPMPRVITMSEEVRSLFANFANESTGAGLESVLCELYDRDSFTSTATKDRGPASGKLMYSLLGGITKAGWDSVFSKVESVESGFLSRVNIIGTEEGRTKAGLKAPDFDPLRNKFFPILQALEKTPRTLDASPGASALMDKWYSHLELPEGISRARLNIHAWRTALHLAWLHGHANILDMDVDGGIKVAEYQAKMREYYSPPEGETRGARCEAGIRKVMRARRNVTLRELRKLTNANRYGIGLWDKALQSLTKAGEVRIADGARKGSKVCILLKQLG